MSVGEDGGVVAAVGIWLSDDIEIESWESLWDDGDDEEEE